jgi:hypothetical protein
MGDGHVCSDQRGYVLGRLIWLLEHGLDGSRGGSIAHDSKGDPLLFPHGADPSAQFDILLGGVLLEQLGDAQSPLLLLLLMLMRRRRRRLNVGMIKSRLGSEPAAGDD